MYVYICLLITDVVFSSCKLNLLLRVEQLLFEHFNVELLIVELIAEYFEFLRVGIVLFELLEVEKNRVTNGALVNEKLVHQQLLNKHANLRQVVVVYLESIVDYQIGEIRLEKFTIVAGISCTCRRTGRLGRVQLTADQFVKIRKYQIQIEQLFAGAARAVIVTAIIVELFERNELDLNGLVHRLEQLHFVRVHVIEQFALVKERLERIAASTVDANEYRTPVQVQMKRLLEFELVRTCYARKTNRHYVFVIVTHRLMLLRRLLFVKVVVDKVDQLYTIQ